MSENFPKVDRPIFPDGYGIPTTDENLLAWGHVQERMDNAKNYWVCTVRPDGRPHCTPVWGVWLANTLYIEGSRETRRAQNLIANPNVSIHLENGNDVVILEGQAHEVQKPAPQLGQQLSQAFTKKYESQGYSPSPENWDQGGLFAIQPKTILAWTEFPKDTTRFTF